VKTYFQVLLYSHLCLALCNLGLAAVTMQQDFVWYGVVNAACYAICEGWLREWD
jgi:(2Fe-2S) ferredoxin